MLLRVLVAVAAVLLPLPKLARADVLNVGLSDAYILAVGDPFPEWTLVDQTGNTITSVSYAGRSYVVWFYPAAMSPGCTAEARGFRDHFKAFQLAGIDVLGVSFDRPETNALFASAEELPFRLLSDDEREFAIKVGAADAADQRFANRISYLVGGDGRVAKVYDHIHPVRHASEVLGDLGVPAGATIQ